VIRVLIADDQPEVRQGFRTMLDAQDDIEVVGVAPDGAIALDRAHRMRPDVVLADIRMPRLDGLELTRRLAGPEVTDPIRVVVVTTFDLDEYVHTALRNGACGFVLKRSGPALLVEAIRAAVDGEMLISPGVTVRLLREFAARAPAAAGEPLTGREREVARQVARGLTNAEIGAELFIGAGTVKTHVAHIQRKVGARNRVGIAAWVWAAGGA
jgi:DNA-binding NarL/FixJ family response regulator